MTFPSRVDKATPDETANPVMVEVTRGGQVESAHRGSAVVVHHDGRIIGSWGDISRIIFPRSAIKPLQAIPLIETGAAEAFKVSDQELALACASHNGETVHVETATGWLQRIGLGISGLACGAHWPMLDEAARRLAASGEQPTALHNNCSGKHIGFLTTALHLKEELRGYEKPEHPVQQRILSLLGEMTGSDMSTAHCGTDGCAIPTWGVPLQGLALAMARFASPQTLTTTRGNAVTKIFHAMITHPFMVAGSKRYCTEVMAAADGHIMVKTGAEGVYCAALPNMGIGIALKCDDGAQRAAETMLTAILFQFDLLPDKLKSRLENRLRRVLENWNGTPVGEIRAAGPLTTNDSL